MQKWLVLRLTVVKSGLFNVDDCMHAGMEAFGGRGRGDGGRRSGFGHKKVLGPGEEGSEDNAGKEDRHPDDMIDGIEVRTCHTCMLTKSVPRSGHPDSCGANQH